MYNLPHVSLHGLNFLIFLNFRYHAGEFLGYLTVDNKLHKAAIPEEDIENPEEYQKITRRLGEVQNNLVRIRANKILKKF